MPRITDNIRKHIIQSFEEGFSERDISNEFNLSKSGVHGIITKWLNDGTIIDRPKSGRKRIYNNRDMRELLRLSKSNPFLTARQLQTQWKKASISTVKYILRQNELFGRSAAKVPFLNKKVIKKRYNWAKEYGTWDQKQWNQIIFSDECSIQLKPTRRAFVRRMNGDRFKKPYTIKTVKHGSKSLMIWGAIKQDGERILKRFTKYADSLEYQRILKAGLFEIYKPENIFQQDGAPCHRSKTTTNFLHRSGVLFISDWPPQSPDINIIENLWSALKKEVFKQNYNTLDQLWESCLLEWERISNECINKLYLSIPKRLMLVRKAKGGNTSY